MAGQKWLLGLSGSLVFFWGAELRSRPIEPRLEGRGCLLKRPALPAGDGQISGDADIVRGLGLRSGRGRQPLGHVPALPGRAGAAQKVEPGGQRISFPRATNLCKDARHKLDCAIEA